MTRSILIAISILVLIGVSTQIYFIFKERNQVKDNLGDLNSRMEALAKENADVKSEIQYLSIPENLEKELKSKFNYKNLGEQMMIVVP